MFDSLSNYHNFQNPLIKEELENLKKYSSIEKKIKRKSPFIAGTLSAIIPGLGKVYAGNNGQALASFLTCGLIGAVAAENYVKMGIKHPQTIFFTGLFGLFYVGNIWGSAVSVQVVKIEKQLENKHNILVSIKIPVSKLFQ
jgi:TM2 domain-containing membrane protein YozV